MDALEWQSSCPAQQPLLGQALLNYTLTMCTNGLDSLLGSSVTETPGSPLTLEKHSLKSSVFNKNLSTAF